MTETKGELRELYERRDLVQRQSRVYDVVEEVLATMSDAAMAELFEGGEKDIDEAFFAIEQAVYDSLYGSLPDDSGAVDTVKQFEHLSRDVEEMMRLTDMAYFIQACVPQFEFEWFHLEWAAHISNYQKLCILAARDTGKSFFCVIMYCIWKMYRYRPAATYRGPMAKELAKSFRGIVVTNAEKLAKLHLENMKNVIYDSPILRDRLYDGVMKNDWGKERIRCANGATLQVYGAFGKIRGEHPGYAGIDDFLNDSSIYSAEQRERYIRIFEGVIQPAVNTGQIVVSGTPYSKSDLYAHLRGTPERPTPFKVFTYPAIYPDGRILNPRRNNLQSIMEKRAQFTPPVFAREMLCMPVSSDSSIFPNPTIEMAKVGMEKETLANSRVSIASRRFESIIMGCDFAMGSNADSDYSVFTTWGIDEHGRMWLLDMHREKGRDYNEQCGDILDLYHRYRHDDVIMEVNGFQDVFAQFARKSEIPVTPHTTTRHNKRSLERGVPALAMKMQQGRIRLPTGDIASREATDVICRELQGMSWDGDKIQGVGVHDDCVMSMWIASTYLDREVESGFGFVTV